MKPVDLTTFLSNQGQCGSMTLADRGGCSYVCTFCGTKVSKDHMEAVLQSVDHQTAKRIREQIKKNSDGTSSS